MPPPANIEADRTPARARNALRDMGSLQSISIDFFGVDLVIAHPGGQPRPWGTRLPKNAPGSQLILVDLAVLHDQVDVVLVVPQDQDVLQRVGHRLSIRDACTFANSFFDISFCFLLRFHQVF